MAPDRTAAMAVSASNSVTTSSPVSGCARWKPRSSTAGAMRLLITSTRSARRPGRTEAAARSCACRSSRACGRNARPSTVSSAPRAVRVNSHTPRSFSSAAIRLETACWVIESSAAASENCPASLTATNVRTAWRSTPTDPSPTTPRCGSPARRLFARWPPPRFDRRAVPRERPPRKAPEKGREDDGEAVAGAAVRVALVGVRGQHARHVARVRRVLADRDPRPARRAGRGVGAGRGGVGRGVGGRGAARPVGRVPPQAAGDDGHGPDPVRRADEHPRRIRPAGPT
jgi:hypothetical protein